MGLFKREPIYLTCSVIVLLAVAEGWVALRYMHGLKAEGKPEKIAALQRELRAKQAEIDHLIFMRDTEHRLASAAADRVRANPQAENPSTAAAEEELFQATAQALAAPIRRAPARNAPPAYPDMRGSLLPIGGDDDVLPSPQGASARQIPDDTGELSPADIDPKHLVNMANIMTGRPVAELTRMKGQPVIRYKNTNVREDDPLWHMLDAVGQAQALREVVLVGKSSADLPHLKKLSDTLESSGVPSSLIRIKTADIEYQGLEGILIALENSKRRNP